jgi:transporter family protein
MARQKGAGMTDWMPFAVGSAVFAGLTAILAKIGVETVPSTVATLIRTVVVLGFVALLVTARREWAQTGQVSSRSLLFLTLSGLTTGLSWLCYYRALRTGPASLVAPIDKLSLLIAVVLAVWLLGERLTAWQWAGAWLMAGGAVLLAFGRAA